MGGNNIPNTYGGGDPLDTYKSEITLTMWTPGLSDNYLDEAGVEDDEMDERESDFDDFARWDGSYPPHAAVAFAVPTRKLLWTSIPQHIG